MKPGLLAAVLLLAGLMTNGALAASPSNVPPPVGPVILNLSGTLIPHSYKVYTATFVATSTSTNLSFAFRDDPSYLELSSVSMTTGGGSNLVVNGNFASGTVGGSAPTGWTYLNLSGASNGGVLKSKCGVSSANCYYDGAVQAYDVITQAIKTTVGATYTVTFDLAETGSQTTFSSLSTDGNVTSSGGNGINLVVYAGAIPSAMEPSSLALLFAGCAGLGLVSRRRRRA
jgi:hypothetical protein